MTLSVYPTLPGLTYTVVKTPKFNTLDQASPNSYEVRISQTLNPVWSFTLIYDFLRDFFWGAFTSVSELRTLMGFFLQMQGQAGSFLVTDPDDSYVGPALSTIGWSPLTTFPVGFGILDSANHWQKVTATTTGITGGSIPTFNHSGSTTTDGGITWTDQGVYSSSGFPNCPLAQLALVSDGAGNWYSPIQRTLDGIYYEDVTDLNGSIAVYENGTLATAGTSPGQYTVGGPGLALPGSSYMGMYLKWGVAAPAWIANNGYALNYEILDPSGHIQKATTAGTSAATIPTFNDSAGTTSDGLVWDDQGLAAAAWASGHVYALGATILDPSNHIQKVTTAGTSGGSTPSWNDTGGTTTDNTVVWTDQGLAANAWAATTFYPLGSTVLDGASHIQMAVVGGTSGSSMPTFNDSGGTVTDNAVVWTDQGAYVVSAGPITAQFNFYFRVRFDSDDQDFEKFCGVGSNVAETIAGTGGGFWTIGGSESANGRGTLKLVTARPAPL